MVLQLRLSATIAPYVDAINEKRSAGWRWADIRKVLSLECTDRALGQAVRRCKWQAQQLPLPELERRKNGNANPAVVPEASDNPLETGDIDYGGFDKPKPKRVFDDD